MESKTYLLKWETSVCCNILIDKFTFLLKLFNILQHHAEIKYPQKNGFRGPVASNTSHTKGHYLTIFIKMIMLKQFVSNKICLLQYITTVHCSVFGSFAMPQKKSHHKDKLTKCRFFSENFLQKLSKKNQSFNITIIWSMIMRLLITIISFFL